MDREAAESWGTLLIQGSVIKPLNFRLTNSFKGKSKYLFQLCVCNNDLKI